MHEVRLTRRTQWMHAALLRKMIPLPSVARAARRHHVAPFVVAAAGQRNQMVPRETLPVSEVSLAAVAILAPVAIASEEECIGDLTAKAAGNVDELDESDDRRFGKRQPFTANDVAPVRFNDLGFALYNQTEGTPDRDHGQRLKGGV